MGKARQTVERRHLGLALRRLREAAGRSQHDAGSELGVSDSRISKIEDGTATLDHQQLLSLLDLFRVAEGERDTILSLGAEARKRQPRGRPKPYTDTLPGSFQRIADLEADARAIYCYEPGVIPGRLQSQRYMRAVMRAGDGIWWQEFGPEPDDRVAFRRARQSAIFDATPPKRLEFVFTEGALFDDGLRTDVMREQYQHLLDIPRKYPAVTIRVLRVGALDNPAPNGGITVYEFESGPPVAFTPVVYGPSTYFHEQRDTTALLSAFTRIQGLALSGERSRELIEEKLREV